jgi:hypothetical protein
MKDPELKRIEPGDPLPGMNHLGKVLAHYAPSNEKVMMPHHYARCAIEPIFFSTVNELDKNRADVIKRIMRWDAKDGIIDLYKAQRDLDIYTTYQEQKAAGILPAHMTFHETPSLVQVLTRHVVRNEVVLTVEELDAVLTWAQRHLDARRIVMEAENG